MVGALSEVGACTGRPLELEEHGKLGEGGGDQGTKVFPRTR